MGDDVSERSRPRFHPLYGRLSDELHSRPAPVLRAPCRISHLALLTDAAGLLRSLELVGELCRRYGAPPPFREHHHEAELDGFELRYERHTEFYGLTLLRRGSESPPFDASPLELVPADWLAALPGEVVAATHIALAAAKEPPEPPAIERMFEGQRVRAAEVMDGAARVWTDWRPHGDGFTRFYVQAAESDPLRLGRLVQRLLELDTYRMMALLALPVARALAPELGELERRLTELTARIAPLRDIEEERAILAELFELAAASERRAAESIFRFAATRAYRQLVVDRLEELRERRLEPWQPLGQFLARRFEPAMRTCEAVERRLSRLSTRVARAADLVRTRVDVELQEQNQKLLASMEQRAALQLRLQETVEGLSVVVLSYYAVGLLSYVLGLAKPFGLDEGSKAALVGGAVPLVVGAVWLALARMRRRLRARFGD